VLGDLIEAKVGVSQLAVTIAARPMHVTNLFEESVGWGRRDI